MLSYTPIFFIKGINPNCKLSWHGAFETSVPPSIFTFTLYPIAANTGIKHCNIKVTLAAVVDLMYVGHVKFGNI